jgi:hypothetical protein
MATSKKNSKPSKYSNVVVPPKNVKKKQELHAINKATITTTGAFANSLVPITYTLTKSNDVILKRLFIGHTKIDLEVDQDPTDPNKFETRGSKKYMCINEDNGLNVVVRAEGNEGGSWSLEINRSGKTLKSNPIKKSTDGNGHLDHNNFHN